MVRRFVRVIFLMVIVFTLVTLCFAFPQPVSKAELSIANITFYDSLDKIRANLEEPKFLWRKYYPGPGFAINRYELEGMQIDLNDNMTLIGIYVYTPQYATTRGIKCGDTLQQVEEAYGIVNKRYYKDYDGKEYMSVEYLAKPYYIKFKIDPNSQTVHMITVGVYE